MNLYITFTRKSLAALTVAILLCTLIAGRFLSVSAAGDLPSGATNALRTEFALGIGYTLEDDAVSSKIITIPDVFFFFFQNYNLIQKQAGFNLKPYAGCKVVVYTCPVKGTKGGDELLMNLIVCDGFIIGGDICTSRIDGYMLPLTKPLD